MMFLTWSWSRSCSCQGSSSRSCQVQVQVRNPCPYVAYIFFVVTEVLCEVGMYQIRPDPDPDQPATLFFKFNNDCDLKLI